MVLAPLAGLGLGDMAYHVGAGLLVLAIGVLLFIPGWIGGGDAKLAAAVALWLGFENLFSYLFCVALAGGSLALLFMSCASPSPARICLRPAVGGAPARPPQRHPLRHCPRGRRPPVSIQHILVREPDRLRPIRNTG